MKDFASRSPHARRRFLAGLAGLSALPLLPSRGSGAGAAQAQLVQNALEEATTVHSGGW